MTDVFISYAREDVDTARQLAERLEAAGFSVWWDPELRAGDDYAQRIDQVLHRVSAVVVLWSRHSVASRWVRAEANEGLERDRLLPIALDDSQAPLIFRALHTPNWRELEADEAGWAELVGAIRDRDRRQSAAPPAVVSERGRRTRWYRGPLTRWQLLARLAGVVLVALSVIAVLLSLRKAIPVELRLKLDEVSFTVVPAPAPPAAGVAELLAPDLAVRSLQWRGAESFSATLSAPQTGRAEAAPRAEAAIGLRATEDAPPFQPAVRLRRPMRVALLPSGHGKLTIILDPLDEPSVRRLGRTDEPGPEDWSCEVVPRAGLELWLREVALVIDGEPLPAGEPRIEPVATKIVWRGGGRRAELGLAPAVVDSQPPLLLAPDLEVMAPSFYRFDENQQDVSFVMAGRVDFPDGDREPLELDEGSRLRLPGDPRLTLRSVRFADGDLDLVFSSRLSRLELGSTLALMDERLPNLFLWLASHQLPALVFSALVVVVGLALALLRLLGLVKKE